MRKKKQFKGFTIDDCIKRIEYHGIWDPLPCRESEIAFINNFFDSCFSSQIPKILILTGRRNTGKTASLHFCKMMSKDDDNIFFIDASIFIKGQNSHHINYFNHNNITNIHNNNSNNTNNYSSSQYNLSACQEHYFDKECNLNFKTDFHQNIYFPSQNMNNITSNNDNHEINNDIHSHNDNSFDYDCFLEFFQNNSTMKIVILENFNPSLNINLIDFFISHNCSIVIVMHEIYGLIQKLSKNIIISCINFSNYSRNQLIDILIEKMGDASSLVSNTVLSYVAQRTVSCGGSVPEAIELLIVICRNAILNGRKRVNDVNLNAHEKEERILRNC